MKYIKIYESLISKNDKRVLNHPLIPLADEIENLLKTFANLQGYKKWSIKKYFSDGFLGKNTINITITYYVKDDIWSRNLDLFKIKILTLLNDNVEKYILYMDFGIRQDYKPNEIQILLQEINNIMSKYVNEENYLYQGGRNEFMEKDINNIINSIKKLTSELESKIIEDKYNL